MYENHRIDQNRKSRKRIGYASSVRNSNDITKEDLRGNDKSTRKINQKLNSSLEEKLSNNDRNRSQSGKSNKSNFSLISTASTKGIKNKISAIPNNKNNRYKKYVFDKKYEEKPQSVKELEKKHNFANKESGYVENFKKPDLDIEMKKERIKMLNINLKGNYASKFALNKHKL